MIKSILCPECAGDVGIGVAIKPETESLCRTLCPVEILNHKNIELIDVYKCENCGYSYVETRNEYGDYKNETSSRQKAT